MLESTSPEISYSEEGFSVAEILEDRARSMRNRRKRVRTRAMLLAVAAREIENVGYDALTVDHIAGAAGMVRGTFYLHFRGRSDILKYVLKKYWALMNIHRPRGGQSMNLHRSIHRVNRYLVMIYAKNTRLLQAREILLREESAVGLRMTHINKIWAKRIVSDLIRRGLTSDDREAAEFAHMKARAVISMSDALLDDIHRSLSAESNGMPVDLDLITRVMDDLWYRSLYMPYTECAD